MTPGRASRARGEAGHKQLCEDEEARDLGTGGDESGGWGGSALISVWRPQVKWDGGDLEAEAGHDHDEGEHEQRVHFVIREFSADAAQRDFAGESVNPAETKQEKRGGHSAEKKVLQRGF